MDRIEAIGAAIHQQRLAEQRAEWTVQADADRALGAAVRACVQIANEFDIYCDINGCKASAATRCSDDGMTLDAAVQSLLARLGTQETRDDQ